MVKALSYGESYGKRAIKNYTNEINNLYKPLEVKAEKIKMYPAEALASVLIAESMRRPKPRNLVAVAAGGCPPPSGGGDKWNNKLINYPNYNKFILGSKQYLENLKNCFVNFENKNTKI